jgi:hypothetical protein
MPILNVALVVETPRVRPMVIKEVAAAVQRQITRDFLPVWGVEATIDPFISMQDVPPGYWPVIVRDDFPGIDIIGIHLDERGQPFALVQYSPTWSLTVSHEVLEMIVDPWGNRLIPGGSPRPGQGMVELLVEVCDPPADIENAYTVNGYLVSDFVTPSYYEPLAVASARYSFTGAITRPRDIARGGYLSWREPSTNEWWAWEWVTGPTQRFRNLGLLSAGVPLRQQVDAVSINRQLYEGAPADHPKVIAAEQRLASSRAASQADAGRLQAQIGRIVQSSRTPPPDGHAPERPSGDSSEQGGRGQPPDPHSI